jgi:hypothetical protein
MFTLSKTQSGQRKGHRGLFRNRICSKLLVLVGLGTMVLAVCSLLSGCGSDSTPGGSVKGKNAKTATKSGTMKPQAVTPLLADQEETGPGKKSLAKKPPDSKNIEVFPGVTIEEVEAKLAANRAKPSTEVFPGITMEEVEAKLAEGRAKRPTEVFPGVTAAQVEAKLAEGRAQRPTNVFPGLIQPGSFQVEDEKGYFYKSFKEKAAGKK